MYSSVKKVENAKFRLCTHGPKFPDFRSSSICIGNSIFLGAKFGVFCSSTIDKYYRNSTIFFQQTLRKFSKCTARSRKRKTQNFGHVDMGLNFVIFALRPFAWVTLYFWAQNLAFFVAQILINIIAICKIRSIFGAEL